VNEIYGNLSQLVRAEALQTGHLMWRALAHSAVTYTHACFESCTQVVNGFDTPIALIQPCAKLCKALSLTSNDANGTLKSRSKLKNNPIKQNYASK